MNYHIILHQETDLQLQAEQAKHGKSPRHCMFQLAQALGASIHVPHSRLKIRKRDRVRSKLLGAPENWALAREIVETTGPEDVIFCNSETSGLPIAALCRGRQDRPKIAVFIHNINRPRARIALRLLQATSHVDWFLACSQAQSNFIQEYLNLPEEKATFVWDQTDLNFFSPGPVSPQKKRPLIMSVGLEKRDYRTLAAATTDLPVDVKISGFSRDARVLAKAFPEVLPDNMSQQFYEWADLLQLYRDADVVVVSTFPNRYAAGVQAMMESMACGRPTVVTCTEGLQHYLSDNDGVIQVPPGDPAAMRQAIVRLLEHPEEAAHLSQRASLLVKERHDSDVFVEKMKKGLEALGAGLSTKI
ncbi:MAG: glycosyltransferase family 4 protein [Cyanobacteria bacterium]|nr:glycosyltransferase family 4 protein [Cyanobacteriota bacterium]